LAVSEWTDPARHASNFNIGTMGNARRMMDNTDGRSFVENESDFLFRDLNRKNERHTLSELTT
jgi:hypothetical protein